MDEAIPCCALSPFHGIQDEVGSYLASFGLALPVSWQNVHDFEIVNIFSENRVVSTAFALLHTRLRFY